MNEKPTLTDAAGWMALPIGIMWSASFLCAMYGTKLPLLSMLGTALGIISIYMLYKQLTNYRRFFPSTGWLHVFCLSLLTCLLAGLLTDGVQYLYFAFLDQGRMLSVMSAGSRGCPACSTSKQTSSNAPSREEGGGTDSFPLSQGASRLSSLNYEFTHVSHVKKI